MAKRKGVPISERFRLVYNVNGELAVDASGQPLLLVCDDGRQSWKLFEGRTMGGDGYLQVWHDGRMINLHRVIYELANGPIPDGLEIDHLDRDKTNNHPNNFKAVTHSQNNRNATKPRRREDSLDLPRGVYRNGKGFLAQIRKADGKSVWGQTRRTVEEAVIDRDELRRIHHADHAFQEIAEASPRQGSEANEAGSPWITLEFEK